MAASIPLLLDKQVCLPAGEAGNPAFANDTTWLYGDSVTLTEELAADSILTGIYAYTIVSNPADGGVQIALCKGAIDEEIVIANFRTRVAHLANTTFSAGMQWIPTVIGIDNMPVGERISFRICRLLPIADGWFVRAGILHKPLAGRMALTATALKCYPDGADDYSITTSSTPGEWSAWNQIRAATGPDLFVTNVLGVQTVAGVKFEIEFGIGGEGAETTIKRLPFTSGRMTDAIGGGLPEHSPFLVPAGERLAWRTRTNSASRTVYMSFQYVEEYLEWFEQ
jgi:hypothetical protein